MLSRLKDSRVFPSSFLMNFQSRQVAIIVFIVIQETLLFFGSSRENIGAIMAITKGGSKTFYLPAFCFAFLSLPCLPRTFTKPTTNAFEGIKEKVRCQVMTKAPPGGLHRRPPPSRKNESSKQLAHTRQTFFDSSLQLTLEFSFTVALCR